MNSVLITGGTGFLGQGLVRRLLTLPVDRVCVYSRGEYAQAKMREEFDNNSKLRWFIGDVRDKERLTLAMQGIYAVIHAAALKRIEVGAYNPEEMVKTNVQGTQNVVAACRAAGVKQAVLISSDKAFEPVSPYGQTKALAESIFLTANTGYRWAPIFSVCRYGNVAGSTGSVIPTWRAAFEAGREVAITDPACTRFWMTREEAVDFVLETLAAREKKVVIPTLPAFRLGDLATAMTNGHAVHWKTVGLGPHEKKHEGMDFGNTSDVARRMTVPELKAALATL